MEFIKDRFLNKVIVLTGAARGIGRSCAVRAAKEGAKLVLVDKLEKEGLETLDMVKAAGGEAIFLCLDLTKEESSKIMVEKAVETFGQLDIAINNAGVMGNPNPVHLMPIEDARYVMENNYFSVFFSCKYELNQFLAQKKGGVICNTASVAGLTGIEGTPAYTSSKHAVNALTKNIALDYCKYGIRCNSINPCATKTPMLDEAMEYVQGMIQKALAAGMKPEELENMGGRKQYPIFDRWSEPEEQAACILFLCSDDASFMTGIEMKTDGGYSNY